jgi:DNA-binding transcriptional LysR family regulator
LLGGLEQSGRSLEATQRALPGSRQGVDHNGVMGNDGIAAERGAAIVPQLALHDEAITTCPHIDLGGRQIGVMYVPRRGEPTPAVRALLDALISAAAELESSRTR